MILGPQVCPAAPLAVSYLWTLCHLREPLGPEGDLWVRTSMHTILNTVQHPHGADQIWGGLTPLESCRSVPGGSGWQQPGLVLWAAHLYLSLWFLFQPRMGTRNLPSPVVFGQWRSGSGPGEDD